VTRRGLVRSLLIVAMAVLYPFHWDIRWINVSLGDGVVALILCLLVFQAAASKFPLPRYVLHAGVLIAVIAVSMIANTLSPPGSFFSLRDSEVEVAKLFAVIAWMVSVCWVVSDDFPPRYLLWSTASVLVACAFAMLTVYENLFLRMDRPTGPFDNANLYGNYLMLNVFLALGAHNLLTEDRTGGVSGGPGFLRAARILFLVWALPALAIGIMSSGSRGTLLGTTIGLLATVSWRLPRRLSARRLWVAALGTVALVATIAWFLAHGPFLLHRLARTTHGDPNVIERAALWRAAGDAFVAHPVFGVGYGQFAGYASATHHLRALVTHETYLSVAAELGVPGLLVFLWLLGAVVRDSRRVRVATGSRIPRVLFGFLVATAVQGLVNNVDQFRSLWIAAGMVAALTLRERAARAAAIRPGPRSRAKPAAAWAAGWPTPAG